MTIRLLSLCLLLPFLCLAQTTPCDGGMAGAFPCDGYDLVSQISLATLSPTATLANDSWGWTDPDTGSEYALVGLSNGTAFIDITDAENPIHLGNLPSQTGESSWRDVKVYNNHAFIVSEATGHGMQVFDLTRLRDVLLPPTTFTIDAWYRGFGNAHNIVINTESGFAYAVGSNTFNGGPHFIDISTPTSPTAAGGYAMDLYSHDAQVITYNGPDTRYTDREILIGSNENLISIVDITDKDNPERLSTISYGQVGYTHQGWFTEDQRYFILGDETDERNFGLPTRTLVFDFNDLENPQYFFKYEGPTNAIDHNGYVVGNQFFMANYNAGMTVLDISRISEGIMTPQGRFDSHPENDTTGFEGAWNVYPFFASGNILISDINRGFLLVRNSNVLAVNEEIVQQDDTKLKLSPNPTNNILTIDFAEDLKSIAIFDMLGKQIKYIQNPSNSLDVHTLSKGVYLLKINNSITRRIVKK